MARRISLAVPLLLATSTSFALPPPDHAIREGANHHVGDDSFVARYHRRPTSRDDEQQRMTLHLAYIRAWLTSRPATRPELAAKRAAILAHFDDYIAKGKTPANAHLPWRTPVFIDDAGTICAVGYLIEQTAGRALPEQIARLHRYDFIDDIAREMPEVAAWVADSGFTLDEIAHIQPAYEEPRVNTWRTWDLVKHPPADGAYDRNGTHGTWRAKQMEGAWTVAGEDGAILGKAQMTHGAGRWESYYADGSEMAEGPYLHNRAHGAWKIYHPSGNLAAEGSFDHGDRHGAWRFYYDTPAETPIAIGEFTRGAVSGTWKHFAADGTLLATSHDETPSQWSVDKDWAVDGGEGFVLDVLPDADGIAHHIHQGTVGSDHQQLELFALGTEHLYIHEAYGPPVMYDGNGFRLEYTAAGWTESNCHWSEKRKEIGREGDLARLHGLLYKDSRQRVHAKVHDVGGSEHEDDVGPRCDGTRPIPRERAQRLDALLASRDRIRSIPPEFVRRAVLGEGDADAERNPDDPPDDRASDLTKILAQHMSMYTEWPHIDGLFVKLYATMAGRVTRNWTDGDPEATTD